MEQLLEQLSSSNVYPRAQPGDETTVSPLQSNVTLADVATIVAEFTPGLGLALETGRGIAVLHIGGVDDR